MDEIAILVTESGLEIPCILFPTKRNLFPFGYEVLTYCQNRITKGITPDCKVIRELEIVVEFVIAPELDERIKELTNEIQNSNRI